MDDYPRIRDEHQRVIQAALASGDCPVLQLRPTGDLATDLRIWATEVSPLPDLLQVLGETGGDEACQQALALVDVAAFNRWRRPTHSELARKMFEVEPLPEPVGLHYYDREVDTPV